MLKNRQTVEIDNMMGPIEAICLMPALFTSIILIWFGLTTELVQFKGYIESS